MLFSNSCRVGTNTSIPSLGVLALLVAHIVLPFASPFAVGTYASTTSTTTTTTSNVGPSAVGRLNHRVRAAPTLLANSNASPLTETTTTEPTTTLQLQEGKRDASNIVGRTMGKLTKYLTPKTHPRDSNSWKLGEYNATLLSALLFRYATPLVDMASVRELVETDAFHVPESHTMKFLVPQVTSVYHKYRSRARRTIEEDRVKGGDDKAVALESGTLLRALLWHQRRALLVTGILRFLNTAIQAFPALLISRLLRLIESGDSHPVRKSLEVVMMLVGVLSVKMIIENQYFHRVVNMSTQIRGALAGLIFDKSLRLPSGGGRIISRVETNDNKASLGDGGVLTLMQSDASTLESTAMQLHTIWDGPLQIIMYTSLLFRYLGPSVLWGIGVLLTVIPLNSITLRILNNMRRFENEAKDSRAKRTSEAISNMKLLKLQGWETLFANDINAYREEELARHSSRGMLRALNQAISNAVPALVLVVTLTAYAKSGRPIVASTIFTAISLFNQLRFPLFFYPMLIDSLANGKNALRRISSYLAEEEITPYVQMRSTAGEIVDGAITMKNGNFLWSTANPVVGGGPSVQAAAPALCGVDIRIDPGEIVAVVGPVGSGKTALIKAFLGELAPVPSAVIDLSLASRTDKNPEGLGILEKPSVIVQGSIAYCSQDAWLPKGTLRDAIVFGREYNEERYRNALFDAGLDEDIEENELARNSMEDSSRGFLSHSTDVGEGGSNLSGGQRARVALARALYGGNETKVFLLDDPLAALDAAVGSTVFDRLTKRLRRSKAAVLLVTNDPNIPRRCDRVALMGRYAPVSTSCSTLVDIGTYDELISRGHDLRSFSSSTSLSNEDEEESEDEVVSASINVFNVTDGHHPVFEAFDNSTLLTQHADPDCVECMRGLENYIADKVIPRTPDMKDEDFVILTSTLSRHEYCEGMNHTESDPVVTSELIEAIPRRVASADELMSKGAVPLSAYVTYLKSVRNPLLLASMLFSFLMSNGAQFFQQFVVAKWTELGRGDALAAALGGQYLSSLVKAAGVVSVFLWLRSYFTMRVGIEASSFLHRKMLASIFKAPMSFFDATPSGQLLSRFGKEMEIVDNAIPDGIGSVLFCFLQIGMSTMALAGMITPSVLFPLFLVGMSYSKTMSRFRPAARDLKRSESRTRSPVYTHFGEALRGKEIIRSIPNARSVWSSQHQKLSDQNLSVYYSVKALDRWLSIRLESLGNIIVFITATVSVVLTRAEKLKAGSAGWSLTQAMAITGLLTWAVRTLTDLETHMMSMMRVQELTDLDSNHAKGLFDNSTSPRQTIPKEKQEAGEALASLFGRQLSVALAPPSDGALVSSGWPWKGELTFNNVSMRYNEVSPLVLKNVSITIPPGTTLGVVGRTGSGKSSLLLTLFRLFEIEDGGVIKIDGIDIRAVSLQTLRSSLSIIPQDPVLFTGTLMYNLDATGKASKEDAWAAMETASPDLAMQFRASGGLDTFVSEGGKNLSSGQRQLICLARALLRKSKILVMDEATSSVDSQTDGKVQQTIRQEFVNKGVTVITVAHRLDTVLGYDKVAVLSAGSLIEFGTPGELLERRGEFRRLVMQDRRNKKSGAKKPDMSTVPVGV